MSLRSARCCRLSRLPTSSGHGTADDAVDVEHARGARDLLRGAGADVLYLETGIGHRIDQEIVPTLRDFLAKLP